MRKTNPNDQNEDDSETVSVVDTATSTDPDVAHVRAIMASLRNGCSFFEAEGVPANIVTEAMISLAMMRIIADVGAEEAQRVMEGVAKAVPTMAAVSEARKGTKH